MLWFGIATDGDWATLGSVAIPFVDFDVNGDQEPDYEVFVQRDGTTDIVQAILVDLVSGDAISVVPVNFNNGDVDTNQFDTNVVLLPVDPAAIGVDNAEENFPITYQVGMFNGATGEVPDATAPATFDLADPGVGTDAPLYLDQGNTAIPYTLGSGTAAKGAKALVLHLHGATGSRAEVLSLPRTTVKPKS